MVQGAFTTVTETTSCLGEKVLVDAQGNRVIAPSRRPDGTFRKSIPIRPGYVHEEEKERFVTRGTLFRQRVESAEKTRAFFMTQPPDVSQDKTKKKKKKKKKNEDQDESVIPPLKVESFTGIQPQESPNLKKRVDVSHVAPAPPGQNAPDNPAEKPVPETAAGLKKKMQQVKGQLKQIAEIEKKISTAPVKVTEEQYKLVQKKETLRNYLKQLETRLLPSHEPES